jgi:hypothetical protein
VTSKIHDVFFEQYVIQVQDGKSISRRKAILRSLEDGAAGIMGLVRHVVIIVIDWP